VSRFYGSKQVLLKARRLKICTGALKQKNMSKNQAVADVGFLAVNKISLTQTALFFKSLNLTFSFEQ
jgi:hypothetical protein